MSDHSSSVFNNSCIKLPRNPKNTFPFPVYEQDIINQSQNVETNKLKLIQRLSNMNVNEKKMKKDPINSFIEFYDSIPEYDDINHLSNKEFYKKLEILKEKQKSYYDYIENEKNEYTNGYKPNLLYNVNLTNSNVKATSDFELFHSLPHLNKTKTEKKSSDLESTISEKDLLLQTGKPSSRRSVRIETPSDKDNSDNFTLDFYQKPKSRLHRSEENLIKKWDNFSVDDLKLDSNRPSSLKTKSIPNSPIKTLKNNCGTQVNGITIPKPFEMTIRDEENKLIDEFMGKGTKGKSSKSEMFKAHPIPIESQIPLFETIVTEQEHKNFLVRERSKALLQSQMRPFSFTKRDEEIQRLRRGLSKSSPSLFLNDPPIKVKKFKAKPIPKNLFSNYIYYKMNEDEFYRALQRKIRAEEMLKAASLPPSMAKREKLYPKYDICPRSFKDLMINSNKDNKKNCKSKKNRSDFLELAYNELENKILNKSKDYHLKIKRKHKKSNKTDCENSSSSSNDSRTISTENPSVSRSNLASLLRIQSARRRMELEMCRKLEESMLKEQTRWKEKLMRKKPIWETLAYSHEEDLAMRLQMRRNEERLRNEEHHLRMELMLGRVNQQPTLFERQSQLQQQQRPNETTKTKKLYENYERIGRKCKRNNLNYLSDTKSLNDMKDESIQALLDEHFTCGNKENLEEEDKESFNEEKE